MFFPLILVANAEVSSEVAPSSRLRQLKIAAMKREFRLLANENPSDSYRILQKKYAENHFQAVVEMVSTLLPEKRNAAVSLIYGNSLVFLGRKNEAVSAFQRAFEAAASPEAKAAALANFGVLFSMSKRWEPAVQRLEQSLEIDRDADHWLGQGLALAQLGVFYFKMGDVEKGAAAHIEALEIAETMAIPWLEARQLSQLAHLYYRDQTYHLARDYYEKAVKIYQALDDPLSGAGALTALSFVYKEMKQPDQSLDLQSKALAMYLQLGDQPNTSKVWLNISLIHRDEGHFDKALDAAQEALQIQSTLGNPEKLAEIEGTLGTIYEKKGNLAEAIAHLKKARDYFEAAKAAQAIHIVDLRIQALEDQLKPAF
ncbi:MAG: tetratricopeptide repeat protein [Nitrospiria bacterium]